MEILSYEKLFVSTKEEKGRKVYIHLYFKQNDEYIVSQDNDKKHLSFLRLVKASYKIGSFYIKFEDSEKIYVYICFGEKQNQIYSFKENIMKLGANILKNLLYINEHINFYLCFNDYKQELVSGIVLSYYKYNFLNKEQKKITTLSIINFDYVNILNGQNFARFLGDTPANLMTPTYFVEYAKKFAKDLNIEVFDKQFMKEKNMNLLLGVAQGSHQDPKLLKIKYNGTDKTNVDVCLVGKGITFDSGGISLKPSANMGTMKGDMMGAAIVLTVIKLAADMKIKLNIEVYIPLTENMPGGSATKPGDVHIGMTGKSVEIDNTDAEGRLVLADCLALAQESNPKYLFDMATLTGAISIALGDNFLGYFCNDDELANKINKASIYSNDLAWRMPLSTLFLNSMKSNVADIKNSGGRKGGSCTAAIFLNEFISEGVKWAHFDIAGVDFDHNNTSVYGGGITGRGLGILYELIKSLNE